MFFTKYNLCPLWGMVTIIWVSSSLWHPTGRPSVLLPWHRPNKFCFDSAKGVFKPMYKKRKTWISAYIYGIQLRLSIIVHSWGVLSGVLWVSHNSFPSISCICILKTYFWMFHHYDPWKLKHSSIVCEWFDIFGRVYSLFMLEYSSWRFIVVFLWFTSSV